MHSTPVPVGNVNLRGKKSRMLSCGCCEAVDYRGDMRRVEDEKEMRAAKSETNDKR